MNAIVTGMRAQVSNTGTPQLAFDVLWYGAPFAADDSQFSSLVVPVAAGDTTAQLSAKVSAAIDTEAQRITAARPGGAVVPTTVLSPAYTKLK